MNTIQKQGKKLTNYLLQKTPQITTTKKIHNINLHNAINKRKGKIKYTTMVKTSVLHANFHKL